jgi:hypothetical protein
MYHSTKFRQPILLCEMRQGTGVILPSVLIYSFLLSEIRENCRLIERTVLTKEPRFVIRVLRSLFSLRKQVTPQLLKRIVVGYYTHSAEAREVLMAFVPDEVCNK